MMLVGGFLFYFFIFLGRGPSLTTSIYRQPRAKKVTGICQVLLNLEYLIVAMREAILRSQMSARELHLVEYSRAVIRLWLLVHEATTQPAI